MGLFNIVEHYDVVYSSTAPATVSGTSDGTIWHNSTDDRNYRYDQVRHKWYSVSDTILMYNRSGPSGNVYLCTGETNDDQIGQKLNMDFTIIAIRAVAAGGDDLTYRIYSDDSEVFNFSTSSLSYVNDSVFVDVDKNTLLKVYAEKAGVQSVDSPVVTFNIAWRQSV
jgi:hypothetical protein